MRRELTASGLVALTLLTIVPAYDRVFETTQWRAPALTAGLGALLLTIVLRRVRGGAALAAAVSTVAFFAVAPWLLGLASRPLFPDRESFAALYEALLLGRTELAETPAPAPTTTGLMLLVVTGWWLVGHVAGDVTARWRRPGLGLISMVVLWAAPLAVPLTDTVGWSRVLPFLAAAGLVLLLVDGPGQVVDRPSSVSPSGLAVGALALTVAFTLPGLLPGFAEQPWIQLGPGASPRGYQPIVDVSQRLGLPDERDVLRVRASQRTYLRLAGLESFDGNVWRLGPAGAGSYRPDPDSLFPADAPLPPEQTANHTEPVRVDVEVLELENIYVPVPYQPEEILGPIRDEMVWSTEGGFLATWDTVDSGELGGEPSIGIREGVEYRVLASRPTPTFEQLTQAQGLDPAVLERFTALPRDYRDLGEQAEAVYAAAGAVTDVERALALQDWFVGPEADFTYDLDVPALRGDDALTEFVLDDRVGYCEYFATAMAVMLRQTGIPARVATGFLPGRVTRPADPSEGRDLTEFTVSTADAHAWVEVLFPGAGWITFEPTPRDDDTQVQPTADDLAPIENVAERRERESEEPDPEPDLETPAPDVGAADPDALRGESGGTGSADDVDGSSVPGGLPLIPFAAGVAGLLALAARPWRRRAAARRSPEERVLDAQRGLLVTAARHGLPRGAHETAVEVVERWRTERRIDERGHDVAVIAQAAAFGGHVDPREADEMERLVGELEQMLRDSVASRERALAPLRLPTAAVIRWARRMLGRLAGLRQA